MGNIYNHIKESIDTIYELTKDGWYFGSFSSLKDTILMKVATELIKRGVVEKQRNGGVKFKYRWIAQSAPTECFYKTITETIRGRQKAIDQANRAKGKIVEKVVTDLKQATSQELWDELKSRGAMIENNQLIIVTKRVLA